MVRGIRIVSGISEWIREAVGTEAENRGENEVADDKDTEKGEEEGDGSPNNSPVCCSAASNSDLTVLET